MDRLTRVLLRVASVALVAVGLWLALRGISPALLWRSLVSANVPLLIGLGLPLLAVGSVLRTFRYAALLPAARTRARFSDLWSAVMLSTAGNNVLPLRAGELLRTRESVAAGYPLAGVAVAQVTEKVVEGATLVVCSAPALLIYVGGRATALGLAGLLLIGIPVLVWAARRFRIAPGQLIRAMGWSLVADVIELAIIAVCLGALHLPAGPLPSSIVFGAVNLAIALPSTPGNVGAFEAGAALPLMALGVDRDAAVAFALVYRVVQWLPVTLLGAALWGRRLLSGPSRRAEAL